MAVNTRIAIAVAGLAGLQAAACFPGMVPRPDMAGDAILMAGGALVPGKQGMVGSNIAQRDIAELPPVRQERQIRAAESVVALLALFLVDMTPFARLPVVQRLYRMQFAPVAAVTLRRVIPAVILARQARVDAAAMVAVKAVGLIMAFGAVMGTPCLLYTSRCV